MGPKGTFALGLQWGQNIPAFFMILFVVVLTITPFLKSLMVMVICFVSVLVLSKLHVFLL